MAIEWSRAAVLAGAVVAGLLAVGEAASAAPTLPRATYAAVGERTSVPFGWVDFCNRYGSECDVQPMDPVDIDLTPAALKDIERIDRQVNAAVTPVTDMDHWGVVDRWDYPVDGKGDCEDYALLKRKILIHQGYPRQALLITVVKDLEGEGHAILTVKTSRGEFVLDNLNDRVMAWADTGYKFIKRQSQTDPNLWQSIGTPSSGPQFTAK
ncbi:transglutaminase [Lichenibacterium minor]|jgi:predicted transglutaminase-like cysteine proteinase|uniref:Transglutaminase n=1 Tax=Lichenibacterium minor TaxID=2316528 RepID=A0A4Q2UA92_9HYPH|nr:transglutaminase-like cysteine peptidase [Lichenibacterium minor]RYC32878.1 transglutaminase [Lichenibacterium minor]